MIVTEARSNLVKATIAFGLAIALPAVAIGVALFIGILRQESVAPNVGIILLVLFLLSIPGGVANAFHTVRTQREDIGQQISNCVYLGLGSLLGQIFVIPNIPVGISLNTFQIVMTIAVWVLFSFGQYITRLWASR